MQLFDRLFNKKEKRMDSDIEPSKDNIKRFLSLKRYYRKKKNATQVFTIEKQDQELLLTQCIETALYLPMTPTSIPTSTSEPTVHKRTISFSADPIKQPRQRRLSLPPQLNNIGYLASIPEVDSQVALNHD